MKNPPTDEGFRLNWPVLHWALHYFGGINPRWLTELLGREKPCYGPWTSGNLRQVKICFSDYNSTEQCLPTFYTLRSPKQNENNVCRNLKNISKFWRSPFNLKKFNYKGKMECLATHFVGKKKFSLPHFITPALDLMPYFQAQVMRDCNKCIKFKKGASKSDHKQ